MSLPSLKTIDPSELDVFSYHFYPKVSERCGSTEGPEATLTGEFLSRIEADKAHYEELRDRLVPDAPMWITETAQAARGGDRWATQYIDVIRYVDVLGRLATDDGTLPTLEGAPASGAVTVPPASIAFVVAPTAESLVGDPAHETRQACR